MSHRALAESPLISILVPLCPVISSSKGSLGSFPYKNLYRYNFKTLIKTSRYRKCYSSNMTLFELWYVNIDDNRFRKIMTLSLTELPHKSVIYSEILQMLSWHHNWAHFTSKLLVWKSVLTETFKGEFVSTSSLGWRIREWVRFWKRFRRWGVLYTCGPWCEWISA